jgi:tetratricopeptide (TPR) repeat protein
MDLTEQQSQRLDSLYKQGCSKVEGLILLDGYRPKKVGFFERRRAKKAIELFKKVLDAVPSHFPSLFFIGKLYQRLMEYETALHYFEIALKYEHNDHSLPQEASLAAMHLNQIDKAIQYSAESVKRKPDHYVLLGNHAMNLLIAGQDKEAKETIDKSISINQTDKINQAVKSKIEGVISGNITRPTFGQTLG